MAPTNGQKRNCCARGCKDLGISSGGNLCMKHFDFKKCLDCKKWVSPRTMSSKDGIRCGKCFDLHKHRTGGIYKMKNIQTAHDVSGQFGFYLNATVQKDMQFKFNVSFFGKH